MIEPQKSVSPDELKALLDARNWTQQDLANELGTTQPNVSRWRTGKWNPPLIYHRFVRSLLASTIIAKKTPGRPLVDYGFDLSKARCDYPDCKRGNRQMWGDHKHCVYQHRLLGKILPVFCNGTHAHPHPRVTRALDTKGRLWKLSDFPNRKKLTPFETERVKQVRKAMREQLDVRELAIAAEELVKALQHCTTTLDGRPGCGRVMVYDGHPAHSSPARRKLHVMYCRKPDCELRWVRRFFDDNGDAQRRTKWGEHCLDRRKRELPSNAEHCPVCGAELRYPKEISEIGGVRYDPPLLRVMCLNPEKKDHGSRGGLTFYYDQKHSKFVQIYRKALKKGHPEVKCRAHGRMRVTTITEASASRVPKDVYKKLGSTFPVYRVRCRFGDRGFWISADRKIKIPYAIRAAVRAVNTEGEIPHQTISQQ